MANDAAQLSRKFLDEVRGVLDVRGIDMDEFAKTLCRSQGSIESTFAMAHGSPITFRTACRFANAIGMRITITLEPMP